MCSALGKKLTASIEKGMHAYTLSLLHPPRISLKEDPLYEILRCLEILSLYRHYYFKGDDELLKTVIDSKDLSKRTLIDDSCVSLTTANLGL